MGDVKTLIVEMTRASAQQASDERSDRRSLLLRLEASIRSCLVLGSLASSHVLLSEALDRCAGSRCAGSRCAGSRCAGSRCAGSRCTGARMFDVERHLPFNLKGATPDSLRTF